MDLFQEMMRREMDKQENTPVKDVMDEAQSFIRRYNEKETFAVGDKVVWKEGMQCCNVPQYGEPVIVLETFPVIRKQDDGTPYGCEPCDMRCIVEKHSDGNLLAYAFDSSRFTKYNG